MAEIAAIDENGNEIQCTLIGIDLGTSGDFSITTGFIQCPICKNLLLLERKTLHSTDECASNVVRYVMET